MDWFILISGILNFFLGAIILFQNPRGKINIGFGIFSLSTTVSILFDFFFRFYPTLPILKMAYAAAVLVPATAAFWILEFSKRKFSTVPKWEQIILVISPPIFLALPFWDGLIVKHINNLTIAGYQGILGPAFWLYGLYFLFFILFFFQVLLGARKMADRDYTRQITVVLFGVATYGVTASLTSIILPQIFGIFSLTLFDAPSLLFFVGFTFYAIERHHLFDIKIIAAELFIILLSFFILLRIIFTENLRDQLFDSFLLVTTIIIGVLFIRSIIREVKTREKIQKLAEDLEKANEQLKILDKQKSEFVSIASHQLRSPLTAIRGYTSMLMEGSYGEIPEKAKEAIDRVSQSSEHLVALVEDLLNVSRIESGKMSYNFVSVDLEKMTDDIIGALLPNAQKSKLDLTFETDKKSPYLIWADGEKIRQVILNLIDNAIKYTPSGFIRVNIFKNDVGSKVSLRVEDSGVGVSPELKDRLFEKFSRGDDKNKLHVNGTGLGLYVAKEMMKAHKGNIWVESPGEGKGSTFFVEFMTEDEKNHMELTKKEEIEHKEKVDEFAKAL